MTDRPHRGDAAPHDDVVRAAIAAERSDCLRGPDGAEGRALGAAVGANVRHARAEADLDLDALAARSGVACELLEQLEAERLVPTLRTVWALAIGPAALVHDPTATETVVQCVMAYASTLASRPDGGRP